MSKRSRPIYYDTETTGISNQNDFIIELAAYDPILDKTFDELINPGVPIPPASTAIHNITDKMVANKPSFKQVAEKFIDFCKGDTILIAHNNDAFDEPFIKNEFNRHGVDVPKWKFLDSLKWARRYRPDLPRHSLQVLREVYGFAANNAHRALDDVVILHKVFSSMIDDLPIQTVYEILSQSQLIQIMPFGKYKGQALEAVPKDYIKWLSSSGALKKKENKDLKISFEKFGLLGAT